MYTRPPFDPNGNPDQVVDKLIGNAYDVVRYLATNLEYVKHVSYYLENIYNVEVNLDNINEVANNITLLQSVFDIIPKLNAIFDALNQIEGVFDNLDNIQAIFDNLAKINDVYNSLPAIENVHQHISEIQTVNQHLVDIENVSQISTDVSTVASISTDINALGQITTSLVNLSNNIADINTLVANLATIGAFNATWLGVKLNDPTQDNNFDPLNGGEVYFNTTINRLKVHNGTNWVAMANTASGVVYDNGLTVQNAFPTIQAPDLYTLANSPWLQMDGLQVQVGSVVTDVEGLGPGVFQGKAGATLSDANFGVVFDPASLGGWDGTHGDLNSTIYGAGGQGSGTGSGFVWVRSVEDFRGGSVGLVPNVGNDMGVIFAALNAIGLETVLEPGTYETSIDTTVQVPLQFESGAIVKPANGAVFICETAIAASAGQQIFDESAGGHAGARTLAYDDRRAYGKGNDKPECPYPWGGTHPLPSVLFIGENNEAVIEPYDVADFAPVTDADYYVSLLGNNSTGDGSQGNPYQTVSFAQSVAEADGSVTSATIHVDAAQPFYGTQPLSPGTVQNFKDVIVKPYNGAQALFVDSNDLSADWALDSGNVYKVTESSILQVVDRTDLDADGDWAELVKETSKAAVAANPGSWYTDGTTVYVHAFDSRSLVGDEDVFALIQQEPGTVKAGSTAYLENIDVVGFTKNIAANQAIFLAKNCTFKHALMDDGVSTVGSENYLQDCTVAVSQFDGFSYRGGGSNPHYAMELNCISRKCGLRASATSRIHNASTAHSQANTVRINGDYSRSYGPVVTDVSSSKSWVVGCTSQDSRSTSVTGAGYRQRSNFYSQNGFMWIEGGTSITVTETKPATGQEAGEVPGSVFDITPDAAYIYVRGLRYSRRVDYINTMEPNEVLSF